MDGKYRKNKMSFFDESYYNGSLSDEEMDERYDSYQRKLNSLLPEMSFLERVLVTIDFHDAKIQKLEETNGKISLTILNGDLQNGYTSISISFKKAHIGAIENELYILSAEIDKEEKNTFLSLLTKNKKVMCISFEQIEYINIREIHESEYLGEKNEKRIFCKTL